MNTDTTTTLSATTAIQEQLDDLVASLVKITQLANKVPTRTSEELLLKVDSEEDEERAK
jgi:hypothetical protein